MSIAKKIKNIAIRAEQNIDIRLKNLKSSCSTHNDDIIILNTAIGSDNLGDEIIMYYYDQAMKEIISTSKLHNIATHCPLSNSDIERLLNCKYAIIIGTNILSPQMELYSGWKFDNRLIRMRNVLLVGVGWLGYKKPSMYSKYVYRNILSNGVIHSVRDEHTFRILKSIGIDNVINTGCLTMLNLDEKCDEIPCGKSDNVLFTLTGNLRRINNDQKLIGILRQNYQKIFFFPQGDCDLVYLKSITTIEDIEVIDRTLSSYTDFLVHFDNIDYIGTRLHGGIHAMQNGKRTIIIAVDNRAIEISHDTGLPVILESEIDDKLDAMIKTEWSTKIKLNNDAIKAWRDVFETIIN